MRAENGIIIRGIELAKILNISDRHLRRLAEEKVILKNGQGKYLFLESVHSYISYLEEKNNVPADLKEEKLKEEIERIKKDTELKRIKIAELKNQLHSSSVIEEVMTNMLSGMKGKLLSIPNKLAPALIGVETLGEIQDIILTEIIDTLTELSEYNPEMFKNKKYVEEIEDEALIPIKKIKKETNKNEKKRGRPKKSK